MIRNEVFVQNGVGIGGALPSCEFPGHHAVVYVREDGQTLDAKCANSAEARTIDSPAWNIVDSFENYAEEAVDCYHCGDRIVPVYDPNENHWDD